MKSNLAVQRNSRGRTRADTLVEVMVGVALAAIAFVSLFTGMTQGFLLTESARENLRGTQILLERLEGVRLFNWNQLTNTALLPTTFTNYFYPLAATNQSKGTVYTGTVAVNNAALTPAASYSNDMKIVTVTVSWISGRLTRTRSMTTYVARNGVQNYVYSN